MTSVRCLSLIRHTAMLCAAFALALGSASAQAVSAADDSASYSSSNAGSLTELSSNTLQPAEGRSLADAALPAAPSAAGQYDNRSRGGGIGGVRSHLTYEVGGGFNAPTEDSAQHVSWGGNVTVGAGYRFNQNASLMVEYQFIDSKLPGLIIDEAGATGGHVHIWSLTLDPVIRHYAEECPGPLSSRWRRLLSVRDKLYRSAAAAILHLLLLRDRDPKCGGRPLLQQPGWMEWRSWYRAPLCGLERRWQDEGVRRGALSERADPGDHNPSQWIGHDERRC